MLRLDGKLFKEVKMEEVNNLAQQKSNQNQASQVSNSVSNSSASNKNMVNNDAVQSTSSEQSAFESAEVKYAGFWIRFLAGVIDFIIIGLVTTPILKMIFPTEAEIGRLSNGLYGFNTTGTAGVVQIIIFALYASLMICQFGSTLGKMVVKIKVTDITGRKVSLPKALLRETVGKLLSAFGIFIGFIWAGFDPRKQGWHDKIAGTLVIHK